MGSAESPIDSGIVGAVEPSSEMAEAITLLCRKYGAKVKLYVDYIADEQYEALAANCAKVGVGVLWFHPTLHERETMHKVTDQALFDVLTFKALR